MELPLSDLLVFWRRRLAGIPMSRIFHLPISNTYDTNAKDFFLT